jgi:phosphoglycolate phosphatase-like HAD superfamily hydrolase
MKLFVWDFHGVLEKGNDDAVLEITNLALEHHGHSRRMTQDEAILLSGLRWHEYFSFLLPQICIDECNRLQSTCFEISQNKPKIIAKHIQLNDHADFVLESISISKHHQILISNTLPKSLDIFIEIVGIGKYFPTTHRFGVDSHNQKKITKKQCLTEFLKDKEYFQSLVSIGDSPGDMALIDHDSKLHGTGYLYSHPNRQHRSVNCHHKINDLRCVLQEIS